MDPGASRDHGSKSSQRAGNPRPVSPINDGPNVGLSIQAGHNPPPRSPAVSALTVSEYDIELDPLPPPAPGTYSTDHLVPKPADLNTETTISIKQIQMSNWPPPIPTQLRPNYKPIPLRWAYHLVLLIFIAGFFAFLEYETRLLPEPGFHSFKPLPQRIEDHSQARRDLVGETPSLAKETPRSPISSTTSARRGLTTAPPRIRPRDPDPIPPESEYPKPDKGGQYCFWYPPQWRFQNLLSYYPMCEYIPFFTVSEDNKDLPLCPCSNIVYDVDNTTRVRLGSVDEYCDAVINVIKTVNAMEDRQYSFWQGGYPYTTSYSWWRGPDRYWMTPPEMTMSPPWIYPSFAANGDVFLPLEKRTTAPGPNGEAVSDVFGRRLEAPYVGYFPAGHTGVETMWTYFGFIQHATDTITHPSTRSILWWQLPLTRPADGLFTGDIPTTMSTPASASPGIITTDSMPSSASATPSPSSPSDLPVVSTTSPSSLQSSTSVESTAQISTDTEVLVSSSSSLDQGDQDPSTPVVQPNSSPNPLPLPSSGTTTAFTTSPTFQSPTDVHPNSSPRPLPLSSSTTTASTTSQTFPAGAIITRKTSIIAVTSETTLGTSTATSVKAVITNGTTSFTTITTAIPILSTTTSLSTQSREETIPWSQFNDRLPTILPGLVPTSTGPVRLDKNVHDIPTQISTKTLFDSKNGLPTKTITGTFMTVVSTRNLWSKMETVTMTVEYFAPRPGNSVDDQRSPGPNGWNPKGGPFAPDTHKFFALSSEKDFLMASLIPVLLATFLAIPIQIFIKTFNHMVPFRSLRHRGQRGADLKGADARDSLCLSRGGMNIFTAPKISFRFIRRYQDPLPLLSFVLDILTTLLIPLSSETIQIEFAENYCTSLDWPLVPFGYRGPCAKGLRKSIVPSRAAEVFLCLMSAIILVMGFVLWRWRTGVATDPWSVASMTALLSGSSEEVKRLMLGITPPHLPQSVGSNSDDAEVEAARSKDIAKALEGKRFRLGYFQVPSSNNHWRPDSKQRGGGSAQNDRPWSQRGPYQQHMSYGLQLVSADQAETGSVRLTVNGPPNRTSSSSCQDKTNQRRSFAGKFLVKTKQSFQRVLPSKKKKQTPGASKRRPRTASLLPVVFLVLITGLLILILYYENTILDTPFERFMDSQTYGVRFLFTAMGTGITTFWDYYFGHICEKQHFSQLQAAMPSTEHERSSNPHPSDRTSSQEQQQQESEGSRQSGREKTARIETEPSSKNNAAIHIASNTTPPNNSSPPTTISPDSPNTTKSSVSSATTAINPPTTTSPKNLTEGPNTATTTTTINTILSPIPSTELHALYHALSLHGVRPKDRLTLASVSIATFLSKFAPILLSGVPFRNTVTWKMHETYTWTLVFVLSYMVLVLGVLLVPQAVPSHILGRFNKTRGKEDKNGNRSFARPPPTSIAGYMYYVCDSHMLRDFEGLSTMPRKARDKAVMEMNDARGHEDGAGGKKGYFMGIMTGVSGVRRVGIDYLHVSR